MSREGEKPADDPLVPSTLAEPSTVTEPSAVAAESGAASPMAPASSEDLADYEQQVRDRVENVLAARRQRALLEDASAHDAVADAKASATAIDAVNPNEPITAELVQPPASPWRFGLGALMAMMAIVSVQCALMSYFGILSGIIAGLCVCLATFSVLLLGAMVLPASKRHLLDQFDTIGLRVLAAMVILVIGTMFSGGAVMIFDLYTTRQTREVVYDTVGFRAKKTAMFDSQHMVDVLIVQDIKPASPALAAGLKKGELVVLQEPVDEFYKRLAESEGKQVDLTVATGSSFTGLNTLPQRTVTIVIPSN